MPYLIATWFQSGRIRPASGSWGSLAALPFCWAIKMYTGQFGLLVFAVLVGIIGTWAVNYYLEHTHTEDPSEVVIDEVLGMALLFFALPAHDWRWIVAGFVLFRILDSLKPGPIGWCDKHIKGARGVMCDDIVAGMIAALSVAAIQSLI